MESHHRALGTLSGYVPSMRREWQQRLTGLWTPDYSPKMAGYPCCCSYESDPACSDCRLGTIRDYVDVLFPVITNGDETCCSAFSEQTYRLDNQSFGSGFGCLWSESYIPSAGNCWLYRITANADNVGVHVTLRLWSAAGQEVHRWRKLLTSPIDCDWDGYEVPWYEHLYEDLCTVGTDTVVTLTSGDYP